MSAPDRKLADMSFGVPSSMTPRQLYEHATGKSLSPGVSINGVPVQTLTKGVGKAVEAVSGTVNSTRANVVNRWKDWIKPKYTLDNVFQFGYYKNDPFYHNILVGGSMAGGDNFITGASMLPFGNLANSESKVLFRWNEMDKVKKEIEKALSAGKHPRVVGHSWGGANIAGIAKDYPDVPFISLDPTSWTGRLDSTPSNLTIFRPSKNSYNTDYLLARLAPVFGGRWPIIPGQGNIEEYDGGHVSGVDEAISRYVHDVRVKRESNEMNNLANTPNVPVVNANQIVKKSSLEKFAQHTGVSSGNSKGLWNRFATKGQPSTNAIPQAKTPSFQASPSKPLYPKQPKDVKPSRKWTSIRRTSLSDVLSNPPGSLVL